MPQIVAQLDATPYPCFEENSKTFKIYYNERTKGRNLLGSNITFYQLISKPHSFEVIKIELFDIQSNSSTSASSHPNSHGGLITSVANILQNIEKSYDKGKFLRGNIVGRSDNFSAFAK